MSRQTPNTTAPPETYPGRHLAILSDTHGVLSAWEQAVAAIRRIAEPDLFIHLGDVGYHGPRNPVPAGYDPMALCRHLATIPPSRFVAVRGNCDNAADEKAAGHDLHTVTRLIRTDYGCMLLEHGDLRDTSARLREADALGARFVLSGHTHIKELETVDGRYILNPGSPTLPKDDIPSAALITDGRILLLDIRNGDIVKECPLTD